MKISYILCYLEDRIDCLKKSKDYWYSDDLILVWKCQKEMMIIFKFLEKSKSLSNKFYDEKSDNLLSLNNLLSNEIFKNYI